MAIVAELAYNNAILQYGAAMSGRQNDSPTRPGDDGRATAVSARSTPSSPTASQNLEQPAVLRVDDTPANLVALEAVLWPLDVRMVRACSGREALEHVEREAFAAV